MSIVTNPNSSGARYSAAMYMGEIVKMLSYCCESLDIDSIDFVILMTVIYYSSATGELSRKELDFAHDKNTEFFHGVVNAKTIYLTARMPRETVRKRLIALENRGLIIKDSGGYRWPSQVNDNDKTSDIRKYFLKMLPQRLN